MCSTLSFHLIDRNPKLQRYFRFLHGKETAKMLSIIEIEKNLMELPGNIQIYIFDFYSCHAVYLGLVNWLIATPASS